MFATSMHTYYVSESSFYAQIVDTNNIRSSIAGRVAMVVGDPAIGDEGGANPDVYRMVASGNLDGVTEQPACCPICGYHATEQHVIELYMTPWGMVIHMMVGHRGAHGEPGGCWWTCPVGILGRPRMRWGPMSHGDAQPPPPPPPPPP